MSASMRDYIRSAASSPLIAPATPDPVAYFIPYEDSALAPQAAIGSKLTSFQTLVKV